MINRTGHFHIIKVPKPNGYRSYFTYKKERIRHLKAADVTSKSFDLITSDLTLLTATHTYVVSAACQYLRC